MIARALAGLPATDWSPAVGEQCTADDAVTGCLPAANTPPAVELGSSEELTAAQLSAEGTSFAVVMLAAGLGLLFLAVPLAAASRGRRWVPATTHHSTRVGD